MDYTLYKYSLGIALVLMLFFATYFLLDCLTEARAMSLLDDVSQAENPTDVTSHTQWSVVYNLSEKKATVCVNRDYGKSFTFYVK